MPEDLDGMEIPHPERKPLGMSEEAAVNVFLAVLREEFVRQMQRNHTGGRGDQRLLKEGDYWLDALVKSTEQRFRNGQPLSDILKRMEYQHGKSDVCTS